MFTWVDGRLVLAYILCCGFSVWAVGYVNYRIRVNVARKQALLRERVAQRRRIFDARGGAR